MNCQYCGAEVTNRMGYCLQCGTKQQLHEGKKPEPVQAPVAELLIPAPEELPEIPEPRWEAPADGGDDLGYCENVPALMLPTGRRLWKMVLFGILTFGIYPTVIWSRIVTELNIAASRHDGKRTMPYFGMVTITPLTLGILPFVWIHRLCGRIGAELTRRGLGYRFGSRDFWLWNVLGSLIIVGPFVFTHRLMKAMNKINEDFNSHG